ncbi:MAG: hypothetical protein SX243_11170 [Acidobacteriota bacterium]|nr:hypothetical protein [Acidobacteriota bacterium]
MRAHRLSGLPALLLTALLSGPVFSADAQPASDSYLTLEIEGERIDGRWALALRDLEYVLGLDENHDGAISWGEVRQRQDEIATYALSRLELQRGHTACRLELRGQTMGQRRGAAHSVLHFAVHCPARAAKQPLNLTYDLFFDRDPTHRGLLRVVGPGREAFRVLRPSAACVVVAGGAVTPWGRHLRALAQVLWPLFMGLGLLVLLLSGSLVRTEQGWRIVESASILWERGLTACLAFALVHGLSVVAAAAGWISLPSLWVELSLACLLTLTLCDTRSPAREARAQEERRPRRPPKVSGRRYRRRYHRALTGELSTVIGSSS